MSSVGSIRSNVGALEALNSIVKTTVSTESAEAELSTGLAISSPSDNPAGYITAQGMSSEIGGMTQALSNTNQGASLTQAAMGGLQQQIDIAQQLYTIANQAANGTQTASERQSLQGVVNQLVGELNLISKQTQFNGRNLLDGTFDGVQFQTGGDEGQYEDLSIASTAASALGIQGDGLFTSQLNPSGNFDVAGHPGYDISAGAGIRSNVTTNPYSSGNVTLTGYLGSGTFAVDKHESAYSLVQSINALSSSTGIQATAQNTFQIKLGSSGHSTYSIEMHVNKGIATGSGEYYAFTNTTGSGLVAAINATNAATGMTASMNASGMMTLTQASGQTVEWYKTTSSGVETNNFYSASGVPFNSLKGTSGYVVSFAGHVTLSSDQRFSLQNGKAIGLLNDSTNFGSYVSSMNVSTQDGADKAMNVLQAAITQLEQEGASVGAFQDGLSVLSNNLSTASANATTALGVLQDANIPAVTNSLSEEEIQAQSGVAALKNSTALQESFLSLLP